MSGKIIVAGHQGNRNIWALSETFLPKSVKKKELTEEEVERIAAQRAIRALGTASPREINYYFPRGRYQNLKKALDSLQEDSSIHRVHVAEFQEREERYIHDLDVKLLESINDHDWQPRISLLPPSIIWSAADKEQTESLASTTTMKCSCLNTNESSVTTYYPSCGGRDW